MVLNSYECELYSSENEETMEHLFLHALFCLMSVAGYQQQYISLTPISTSHHSPAS